MSFRAEVLRLVTKIPRGRVATYGQLATLLDRPRWARAVGQALRDADEAVPWHRVVNAQGAISRRARMSGMMTQRIRLEQEGVAFRRGRVVLSRFRWQGSVGPRRRAVSGSDSRRAPVSRHTSFSRDDKMLGGNR
ncbi:MAG TPA: MGMT family protein [Methylomirabilota bacterium]|nr:MGMT family protein [Methylomirabilota bacterium]